VTWNLEPQQPRTPTCAPSAIHARRRLAKAGAALLVAATLVPGLTGCFNGQRATTTVQATQDSSNGTQARIGSLRVENATLVTGPKDSKAATLIMSLFNDGREADTLVSVTIDGQPAIISGAAQSAGGVELAPGAALTFGYQSSDSWLNAYDIAEAPSAYVPVQMTFRRAGVLNYTALSVPAVGIYEGIAPNPATAPAATQ
jgi:hypothetical protein